MDISNYRKPKIQNISVNCRTGKRDIDIFAGRAII